MAIVIPYAKQTWTDGSGGGTPISAARLGVVEEGILDVSQGPAVRVFHNTTQSTTSGVGLALAFNSERFDQAGNAASTQHDTVTNNSRLTALYAGIYQISVSIQWASSAAGTYRQLAIRINGTDTIAVQFVPPLNSAANGQAVTALWSMAVNDYAEAVATQDSGGALNVLSTAKFSPEFMMVRVA